MADTTYLKKRRQTWYFAMKIPADVRHAFDEKSEVVKSLGTRDLTKAQSARWALVNEYKARIDVVRGHRELTPAEIEERANEEFDRTLREMDEYRQDEYACDVLMGYEIDRIETRRLSDLEYALSFARIKAANGRIAALNGKIFERPLIFGRSAIDPLTLRPVTAAKNKTKGASFKDIAARYLEEIQRDSAARITAQTQGQYEAVFRLFDQWADGPELDDIDRAKASKFLTLVSGLDPHWGRSSKTKERSFSEIMELYGNHEVGLSNRTINRFSMALGLVWKWAKRVGEFNGDNPWEGQQRREGERRKVGKLPFTSDELKLLLRDKPEVAPEKPNYETTLRWVCWIAAYSGMRLNEICNRTIADIKQRDGIWCFDITNAKTEAGDRLVPIHSHLIELGFIDYLKRQEGDWLFPALKPGGPDQKRSWYLSKTFTTYRRKLGVTRINRDNNRDRVDFHSFRRSVIQVLERARLPQTEVAQVVGHEKAGITFGTYNPDGLEVGTLRDVIEAIRYPALDSSRSGSSVAA
tara:strand:+ start:50840 stop:52414 length:1575 start_codon:yes stop_codon:yes gene_type:complete